MENKSFSVQGYFEHATLLGDYDRVKSSLSEDPQWAAKVMEHAEERARIIDSVRICNKLHPSRIRQEKDKSFLAIGTLGKKQALVYRIEKHDEESVKIKPVAFLETKHKVGIAFVLTLFYIVPVVLAPMVWQRRAEQNLRLSRYYLVSTCHYLENQLA